MTRLVCCLALWCALAGAADLDRRDPQAVAGAYLKAIEAQDAKAVLALVTADKGVTAFLKIAVAQMKDGPQAGMLQAQGLGELAVLPMGLGGGQTLGAPVTAGATATYTLKHTLELNSRLVLAKQADGTWLVDLRASLQATAGEGRKSAMLSAIDMMGAMPETTVAMAENQVKQPWECANKMRGFNEAINAWCEEHGDKYPLAAVWMDQLEPYLEKTPGTKPFACPDHADEEFSFAFNAELSGKPRIQGWEAQNHTPLLACVPGDKANLTFKPDDLAKLKPRHGQLNTWLSASGQQFMLREGWSPDRLWNEDKANSDCQTRLRDLVTALKAFAKAHNGRLPAAASWCDDLEPLLRAKGADKPFGCPASTQPGCCYAYNQELDGADLAKLVNHRKIVAFIETKPGPRNQALRPQALGAGSHYTAWNAGGAPVWHRAMLSGAVEDQSEPAPR